MIADSDESADSEAMKSKMAEHDKLVEEIFQHEDKDRNGFISHEEFSGPKHDELWELPNLGLGLQNIISVAGYRMLKMGFSWH